FVLVYKSSRMINFAVGEWIMLGALAAGAGHYAFGLGSVGAVLFAVLAMAGFGIAFNGIVVTKLTSHPVISLIMVTIGLGAMMRGMAALVFTGIPSGVPLPVSTEPLLLNGFPVSPEKLIAALTAAVGIALLTWFYHHSRTGIALRAIADDPTAASAAGINTYRLFALVWAITGIISVVAGILWVFVTGGGFGEAVVGRGLEWRGGSDKPAGDEPGGEPVVAAARQDRVPSPDAEIAVARHRGPQQRLRHRREIGLDGIGQRLGRRAVQPFLGA